MTALLLGLLLGEPEPVAATTAATDDALDDAVATMATVTPPAASLQGPVVVVVKLSDEFKWPPIPQADQVDEEEEEDDDDVAGAASDVKDDEEDELSHLDAVDVTVPPPVSLPAGEANSDERKETERRGDDDDDDEDEIAPVAIPFRTTPPDRIASLLLAGATTPSFHSRIHK